MGRSFETQIIELKVGDKTHLVLPRQLQLHPATDRIMSCNFLTYKPGVLVDIPLHPVNEDQSTAIRKGAFFLQVTQKLKVQALSTEIPTHFDINLAGKNSKDVIRLCHIEIPSTVVPIEKNLKKVIGSVIGKKNDEPDEAKEAAATAS
jgi:large subunit ribosomal protein L25